MALRWCRFFVIAAVPALAVCAEPNRSWDVLVQSLQPGRTVVVTRMNLAKVEGKLLGLSADSITVRWHGQPQVVQKADVLRVRIANIRRKHTLIAMGVGAAVGAVLGAASSKYNQGANALAGAILGVPFGAIAGGVAPIGKPLYEAAGPLKQAAAPPARE